MKKIKNCLLLSLIFASVTVFAENKKPTCKAYFEGEELAMETTFSTPYEQQFDLEYKDIAYSANVDIRPLTNKFRRHSVTITIALPTIKEDGSKVNIGKGITTMGFWGQDDQVRGEYLIDWEKRYSIVCSK